MATEPRMTGPGVVADTALGTHECLFYDTKEDLLDALIPYFRSGLADSQAGLWIVSEPLALSDATEALRRLSVSPDSSPNHAGIEIISFTEWYLAGGTFDLRRVLQRFQEKLAAARASGYSGLRCTGDAGWLGGRGRKKLHEYETALGRSLLGQDTRVLCTHPLAACSATDVLDAEHIHGRAATIRTGVWRVLKAPRSWPSADKASKLDQHQLEDKVTDGTRTLRATNEELIQEIAERRQVEAELRTQKEVLQQIFDHIPVMINVLDSNGRVLMVNREWECTLGWTLEETKTDNVNVLAECYPDQRYQESV